MTCWICFYFSLSRANIIFYDSFIWIDICTTGQEKYQKILIKKHDKCAAIANANSTFSFKFFFYNIEIITQKLNSELFYNVKRIMKLWNILIKIYLALNYLFNDNIEKFLTGSWDQHWWKCTLKTNQRLLLHHPNCW